MTGAVVALVALSGSVMAAGPVFQNGSFENGNYVPTYEGQDYERLANGSTAITGWTVTKGNVDWTASGIWQAADGTKSVDLDGAEETAGAISQTFETHLNGTYVVTFAMSGNPGNPAVSPSKTMTVDAAGTATPYIYDTTGNDFAHMNYVTKTFSFTATGPTTTLTFTSTTASGWGPVIDNIVITETNANGPSCKNSGWKTMTDRFSTPFKNQGDCVSYYATGEKNLAL
jgi:choice-of-anchor C domain-containing protein